MSCPKIIVVFCVPRAAWHCRLHSLSASVLSFSARTVTNQTSLGRIVQGKFSLPHPLYNAASAWRQAAEEAGLKERAGRVCA